MSNKYIQRLINKKQRITQLETKLNNEMQAALDEISEAYFAVKSLRMKAQPDKCLEDFSYFSKESKSISILIYNTWPATEVIFDMSVTLENGKLLFKETTIGGTFVANSTSALVSWFLDFIYDYVIIPDK